MPVEQNIQRARAIGLTNAQINQHNWNDRESIEYDLSEETTDIIRHVYPNRTCDILECRPEGVPLNKVFNQIVGMPPKQINNLFFKMLKVKNLGFDDHEIYNNITRLNDLIEKHPDAVSVRKTVLKKAGVPEEVSNPLSERISSLDVKTFLPKTRVAGILQLKKKQSFVELAGRESNNFQERYFEEIKRRENECEIGCSIL